MEHRDDQKQQELLDKPFGSDGTEKEYVDLWKYFEGIGNNAKSQMITAVNIMLTLASGLLSYIIANTFIQKATNDTTVWCLHDQQVAYAGAILGICLGVLTLGLVYEYRNHAYRNWWRATRCKNEVSRLHFLVTDKIKIEPLGKMEDFKPSGQRVAFVFTLYFVLGALFLLLMLATILTHAGWITVFEVCKAGLT